MRASRRCSWRDGALLARRGMGAARVRRLARARDRRRMRGSHARCSCCRAVAGAAVARRRCRPRPAPRLPPAVSGSRCSPRSRSPTVTVQRSAALDGARIYRTLTDGALRPLGALLLAGRRHRVRGAARAAAGAVGDRRVDARASGTRCCRDFVQTVLKAVLVGWAARLGARLSRRHRDRPAALPAARPAADRLAHQHDPARRGRADHGDVVRLRVAVEGGGRRADDVLPDAHRHARRPARGRQARARADAQLRRRATCAR